MGIPVRIGTWGQKRGLKNPKLGSFFVRGYTAKMSKGSKKWHFGGSQNREIDKIEDLVCGGCQKMESLGSFLVIFSVLGLSILGLRNKFGQISKISRKKAKKWKKKG